MPRKLLAASLIALVLLFLPLTISERLRSAVLSFVAPVGSYLSYQGQQISNSISSISQISSLREERKSLQQEVVSLQQRVSDEESLRRENDILKKELGINTVTKDTPKVFAEVATHGINPLDPTFSIAVGSAQGIVVGQPAVYQGVLVGRVITVRENSAIIRTIISPKSIIQVWLPELKENALLLGDGNTVRIEDVNQGVTVPEGTVIETSGLGGNLPQGVIIGSVDSPLSGPNSTSQQFRVELTVNPKLVESVIILLTDPS